MRVLLEAETAPRPLTGPAYPGSQVRTDSAARILALLAAVVALAAVYSVRVADADIWGHLRYGELFLALRDVAPPDPFAYTTEGLSWHTHEYLAQIVLYLAYAGLGVPGLILLKVVLGLATIWLIFRTVRLYSDDVRVWSAVIMLGSLLVGRYLLFRPQLFTYFFFALFTYLLHQYLIGRRVRLWLLPLLTIFWANLHGGFVAGIGLVGVALGIAWLMAVAAEGWRPLAWWRRLWPLVATLAGCGLASLATPHGWRLWSFLAVELTNSYNGRYIFEWYPAWRAPGLSEVLAGVFLLLGVVSLSVAQLSGRSRLHRGPRCWHLLLGMMPLAVLAIQSVRHIPLFAIWTAPAVAAGLQRVFDSWQASRPRWARRGVLALLAVAAFPALLTVFHTLRDPLPQIRITDQSLGEEAPLGAVLFMQANQLRGNAYVPLWWGSYLTWELYPDILVSMDGRNDTLYPVPMVGENLAYYLDEEIDPAVPLRYPSDYVLAPASSAAAASLVHDPAWHLLYRDDQAVLLVRNDEAHAGLVARSLAGMLQMPTGELPAYLTPSVP